MRFRICIFFLAILIPHQIDGFDLKCVEDVSASCRVNSLVLTSRNEMISSVNGVTTPSSKTHIGIASMTVHYLPKGIGKFFPKLNMIMISLPGLKLIEASDFENMDNLKSFWVYGTDIEVLSNDLFKHTPKINFLYLSDNKISRVGKDVFKNLPLLTTIYMKNNKCINSQAEGDLEAIKKEIQSKCPEPIEQIVTTSRPAVENEVTTLKPKSVKELELEKEIQNLKSEVSSLANQNSQLKAEIDRLKETWYNGLLDSCTKILHENSAKLKECRNGKAVEDKSVEKATDVILKILSVADNTTSLEMIVKSREPKVTRIVDVSGLDAQQNRSEIIINEQNVLFLPINLGQFLPSVQRLSITFSGLYELDTRTFNGMENLIALNLTGNKLVEISEKDFAELKSLKELDLSQNNIEIIHEESFAANVELVTLKLNNNKLVTISSPIFKHQKKLRFLQLNDNMLKFINAALLLSSAYELVDLRNNDCINLSMLNATLQQIETEITEKCMAPVQLKCNNRQENQNDDSLCEAEDFVLIDRGSKLTTEMTGEAEKIQKLFIIEQKMFFIPAKLHETFPNLVSIIVDRSQLTALLKMDFNGLTLLTGITIVRNNISLIEEGVFDEVPQLINLNLGYNHIELLTPAAFAKLTKLQTLILSGNKLKTFTASLLPNKPEIKELHLNENFLEVIERKVIKILKNADLIDLSDNTCIDIKYQKSDLRIKTMREFSYAVDFECGEDSKEA